MSRLLCVGLFVSVAACGSSSEKGADAGPDDGGAAGIDAAGAYRCGGRVLEAGDHARTLTSGDLSRSYVVRVPPGYDGSESIPLVLLFHGGGVDADVQESLSHLGDKADEAGFVLVRPDGTGQVENRYAWNAGSCCGQAASEDVDDVGFVRDLVATVSEEVCIDGRRVFATGFSNGAMMAHRLGCELDDLIAAIAPVSGGIGVADCTPSRPVPVFEIHGLADEAYPFNGGPATCSTNPTDFTSIPDTVRVWGDAAGCDMTSTITYDEGDVTCRAYDGCEPNGDIELCVIAGGEHDWPGGDALGGPCSGPPTTDLVANDAIWDFFAAHPLPDG